MEFRLKPLASMAAQLADAATAVKPIDERYAARYCTVKATGTTVVMPESLPERNIRALADYIRKLLSTSPYAKAARAVGFQFGDLRHEQIGHHHGELTWSMVDFGLKFKCICGREEFARIAFNYSTFESPSFDPSVLANTDIAHELYKLGSFGKEHLLRDGYTDEDASRIEREYKAVVDALLALEGST